MIEDFEIIREEAPLPDWSLVYPRYRARLYVNGKVYLSPVFSEITPRAEVLEMLNVWRKAILSANAPKFATYIQAKPKPGRKFDLDL